MIYGYDLLVGADIFTSEVLLKEPKILHCLANFQQSGSVGSRDVASNIFEF